MILYRLAKAKYAADLSGRGAEKAGGRWNSKGIPMVYAGQSRALCVVEIAVHTPIGNVPADYVLVSLEVPDHLTVDEYAEEDLPADWKQFPHPHSTQQIGNAFALTLKSAVLRVPSAIIPAEHNYLLNPLHPDMRLINVMGVAPFTFDERLFLRP